MMRFLKTTTAIILCFSVLLHSGIVDFLFGGIHNELKKEVLKEIYESFNNHKIEEVYKDGIFYEKITTITEDGKEIVKFVKDEKENHFIKKTEDYSKKNNSSKQKSNQKVKILLYCSISKALKSKQPFNKYTAKQESILKVDIPSSIYFKTHSPPPELA
ncbi:MAG: hypothetical protein QM535_05390 [Limnohabitans sp.]|nr:hypothetical protein [Limnohabitans sp.]